MTRNLNHCPHRKPFSRSKHLSIRQPTAHQSSARKPSASAPLAAIVGAIFALPLFFTILFEVIEHLREPATLLAECRRVLAPDGVLATRS